MKKKKKVPNCQKRAAVRVILIVFDGVLCDLCAYTGTRYQKNYYYILVI